MLTARGEETDRVVGLELGADDYVVKPFSAREVVARIRAVLRRARRAPGAAAAASRSRSGACASIVRRATRDARAAPSSTSPAREFDLLELLMREAGSVVTRERLIDEVWDMNWFGSTKTLDVHVSSLRRKLGDDSARRASSTPCAASASGFAGADELGMSLSARRLLAAFAYVLVLVIVALEVPLALNLSRRVDAEIKSEAQGQAQLLAATAGGRLRTGRELAAARRTAPPATSAAG